MVVTIHRIERLTFEKVTFYTVQVDGNNYEFEDFKDRLCVVEKYQRLLARLFHFIIELGTDHGAKEHFFKYKASGHSNCGVSFIEVEFKKHAIILYCIRVNDSNVILLNGDIKTDYDLERCSSKKHFDLANKLSSNIESAILKTKNVDLTKGLIELADNTQLKIF